jgi:hypothetical protein
MSNKYAINDVIISASPANLITAAAFLISFFSRNSQPNLTTNSPIRKDNNRLTFDANDTTIPRRPYSTGPKMIAASIP